MHTKHPTVTAHGKGKSSPIKANTYHLNAGDIDLVSRCASADELARMARAVSRLPDFRRDKLSSIYCDSGGCEFHAKTTIIDTGALADLCWALAAELSGAFDHHVGVTAYGPSSATSPPPIQCTAKLGGRT